MEGIHTFGQLVKERRKALGLTQASLAQRVACSKSMINKIESDIRIPSKPIIELLALHLKIPPADYVGFVHLAQPNLLVESSDVSPKGDPASTNPFSGPRKVLPIPFTPLIGLERAVATVSASLQQTGIRLLTLTGPGGIGKTSLALQVATELNDKFSDGVYFISLAPVRDPALVLSAIVQALGIKSMGDQRDDELLVGYLHEKSTLLILDNFEQALPATKAIAELLTYTNYLKVLVTSRAVLRLSGEHEFMVTPLDVPDLTRTIDPATLAHSPAVQLFVQRAQAVRADFTLTPENANSVAEICARLEGLPLAIMLAAARCKVLSPHAILARLTGAMGGVLDVLAGGIQDLPARQQTIRQTIDWSYNLLNEREQTLFRRLGVFVGGCSLDAIEKVYDNLKGDLPPRPRSAPHVSALDSAIGLVDKSLLRPVEGPDGEPRFSMSETLREYALECLIATNELEMMHQQHAAYFLQMVDTIIPNLHSAKQESSLKLLDMEYNNIRAVLTWSCVSASDIALQLASGLWDYWLTRGYLSEGRAWLTDILQRSRVVLPALVPVRAQALNGAGLLASVQGDQKAANSYLQESLRLFRELNNQMGEAWVLNHLGQTLNLSGQQDRAVSVFEASLQLFRQLGDNWHCAWVLINLGDISLQRSNHDSALPPLSEARDLFRACGDKRGAAAAIDRLARLALLHGDANEATALFSESMRLFSEIGDRCGIGWALHYLGRMAYEDGDYHEAVGNLIESLRLFDKMNDRWGIAWSLLRLAIVTSDLHQPERAVMLFGAADTIMADFEDRMSSADRAFIHGTLAVAREHADVGMWAKGKSLSSEKALVWISQQPFLIE